MTKVREIIIEKNRIIRMMNLIESFGFEVDWSYVGTCSIYKNNDKVAVIIPL